MMMKTISGKTIVCGIIADPVEHTMSPVMHNTAFKALGLNYVYVPFLVKGEELGEAIEGMRALHIRGLNVTIPHKVAVIPFLDKLDPVAEKIGAVNTIVNDNDVLTGYNTDAIGFLQALLDKKVDPKGKKILVMGAGGAARAICCILADNGADLCILNRKLELDWAYNLAKRISQHYTVNVTAGELDREHLQKSLADTGILVNATSVGMSPDIDRTPIDADLIRPGLLVVDIVYNPLQTLLLKQAQANGARTISGLDMLAWQGAVAFEKWTGQKAPLELMREEAGKLLQKHEK
jgi:shikimate dehydrogenase